MTPTFTTEDDIATVKEWLSSSSIQPGHAVRLLVLSGVGEEQAVRIVGDHLLNAKDIRHGI